MGTETQLNKFADRITANATFLLMIAVICYFITLLFGVYMPVGGTEADAYFLGSAALAGSNMIELVGLGSLFALLGALLTAIVQLFAGLSFAAVCFDESKNIWFRVVAVAALMLIMFGGLNIM